jgi:hypothetical protein
MSSRIFAVLLVAAGLARAFGQPSDSQIEPGKILEADRVSRSLIGMQYEN